MQISTTTKKNGLAAWDQAWRDLYATKRTHHCFLLHGNTGDYVHSTSDLRTHLAATLARKKIVVNYNRGEGFTFLGASDEASEAMKLEFMTLLGLAEAISDDDRSAFAEAMGGQGPAGVELPRDPMDALPLIDRVLRLPVVERVENGEKVLAPSIAVILDFVEKVAPAGSAGELSPEDRTALIILQRWAQDPRVIKNGHPIFFVTSVLSDVNSQLYAASSRIACVEIPMPSTEERRAFIDGAAAANAEKPAAQRWEQEVTTEEFARLTAGLGRVHIGEIIKSAFGQGVPVTGELIRERKRRIIRDEYGGIIEELNTDVTFEDIGGLEHVKEWMDWAIVQPMTTGENLSLVPMGVLLAGPAGVGKTVMAQALANACRFSALQMRVGQLMGGIVGQSERNLERVITCCEAMAPMLLFVDELDQQVQRSSTNLDSGVQMRIFQRLLEWMADGTHRGQIIVVAASNRPKSIDPALKRPGRIDNILVFPAPEDVDREAIVNVMTRKYVFGAFDLVTPELREEAVRAGEDVAEATEGWTGAELEKLARKAKELILRGRAEGIRDAYQQALGKILPRTAAIWEMTLEALSEIDDTDLLPERYHKYVRDRKQLKAAQKEVREELGVAVEPEEGARGL